MQTERMRCRNWIRLRNVEIDLQNTLTNEAMSELGETEEAMTIKDNKRPR
jgi:hypothetical protein